MPTAVKIPVAFFACPNAEFPPTIARHVRQRTRKAPTYTQARRDLNAELAAIGAKQVGIFLHVDWSDIDPNRQIRASIRPRSPRVVVQFRVSQSPQRFRIGSYGGKTWIENLSLIAKAIRACRVLDTTGTTYRFAALELFVVEDAAPDFPPRPEPQSSAGPKPGPPPGSGQSQQSRPTGTAAVQALVAVRRIVEIIVASGSRVVMQPVDISRDWVTVRRYIKLAMTLTHPDRTGGNAERFKEVCMLRDKLTVLSEGS